MKRIKWLSLTIILFTFFAIVAQASALTGQSVRASVTEIVTQMPAKDSQQRDQFAAELAAMNPKATADLAQMLQSPDDNPARYGLSAMTHYLSRDGAETQRAVYANALIDALKTPLEKQDKAFLIEQLQLVGKSESVQPLGQYLTDQLLCVYAARALLTIGSEGVEPEFMKALDKADSAARPTIIKSLGELQTKAAAEKISAFAASSDSDTRETALYALANIGDPASESILKNACNIGSDFEQLKHQSQYLLYARRLAETDNKALAVKICKSLIDNKDVPDHNRAAAASSLNYVLNQGQAAQQAPPGFISLFNGKDLTGWKMHDGLPGDKTPTGKWFVEDRAIVGVQDPPGKGGFLSTTETFRNFELMLETKVDWPFDTGVFLRVGPDGKSHQVTLDYRQGGEIGGIYCPWTRGFVHHCPNGIDQFKKDQWNQIRITCQGEPARIQVWVNGAKVTDFQHAEKNTAGIPEQGTICLQIHPGGKGYDKSRARFRNIYVRPIINTLTPEEKAQGYSLLFNGKDLTGWVGSTDTYGVKDGILFCRKGTGRNIFTEKEYDNFIIRFEFRLQPGSNNGLGIRAPIEGDAAYLGMELQIIDNTAEKYSNLQDWQYHGSVYGISPADEATRYTALNPVGQWNYEEVIADRNHIIVKLNGTTILDTDIKKASNNNTKTLSKKAHPGLLNKTGHIGFLGHGDFIEFRNIRILPLN